MIEDKSFHFFDEKLDCLFDILLTEPPANEDWKYKVELWTNRMNGYSYLFRRFENLQEADAFFLRLQNTLKQGYGGLYIQ